MATPAEQLLANLRALGLATGTYPGSAAWVAATAGGLEHLGAVLKRRAYTHDELRAIEAAFAADDGGGAAAGAGAADGDGDGEPEGEGYVGRPRLSVAEIAQQLQVRSSRLARHAFLLRGYAALLLSSNPASRCFWCRRWAFAVCFSCKPTGLLLCAQCDAAAHADARACTVRFGGGARLLLAGEVVSPRPGTGPFVPSELLGFCYGALVVAAATMPPGLLRNLLHDGAHDAAMGLAIIVLGAPEGGFHASAAARAAAARASRRPTGTRRTSREGSEEVRGGGGGRGSQFSWCSSLFEPPSLLPPPFVPLTGLGDARAAAPQHSTPWRALSGEHDCRQRYHGT